MMTSSEIISVIFACLGFITTILAVTFAILTYSKSRKKDAVKAAQSSDRDKEDIRIRLVKMETDIAYIREKLDERHAWEQDIEARLRKVEARKTK